MPMIEFENVSKWYGSFQVLTDVSLSVAQGEKIVVCGPSGSGKSTLIRCVNALEPYQKGKITVGGVPRLMKCAGEIREASAPRNETGGTPAKLPPEPGVSGANTSAGLKSTSALGTALACTSFGSSNSEIRAVQAAK